MSNTNSFNIVGLDFDDAKTSLKAFLQSQETLKDYNFDGSILNTVLDVLAYNTHYQSFYANMVANEMFLDSAVLRPSVVSHAKNLGYVPTSRRAAKAVLTLLAPGSSESTYLSRGSEFVGTDLAGTQYRFVLLDTVYADASTQSFKNITVHEGTLRRMSYVYDPSKKPGTYLLIPNDKIDTSTIRVRVKASATDNTGMEDVWTYADSYIDLTPTSKVFFLQEKESGMYELFFGDDFLGKKPKTGNIVIVEYLETNGDAANAINRFSTNISGISSVQLISQSSGGSLEESVSSVKFLAPRYYQAQNRAVTESDYTAVVMKEYPTAASVYVYGGDTTNPPQYGKVFIAVKPKTGTALTKQEKLTLSTTLKQNRSVVTITPELVDPDYIDLVFDSIVTIDTDRSNINLGTLKALIVAYIYTYSATSLENFGSNFYLSKIVQGINGLNSSVLTNQTTVKMRKFVDLSLLRASKGFSVNFRNPISRADYSLGGIPPQLSSSEFSHIDKFGTTWNAVTAIDDGNGNINLVRTDTSGDRKIVYSNIGTIDYDAGVVSFSTKFQPVGTVMTVTVQPRNTDLFVFENKIFRINRGYSDSVKVSLVNQTARKQSL